MSTRRFQTPGNLAGLEDALCYTMVGVNSLISLWSEEAVGQALSTWSAWLAAKERGWGLEACLHSSSPSSIFLCPTVNTLLNSPHAYFRIWLYHLKCGAKHMLKSFSEQMQYLVQYLVQFNSPNTTEHQSV